MKFLDSNVFIYAFYRPGRHLSQSEKQMKDLSKKIVAEVEEGKEKVVTTVVHLSQVVNILKHGVTPEQLAEIMEELLMLDNLEVEGVDKPKYLAATELGRDLGLDANDALAVQAMQSRGLREIFSFDKAFENVNGLIRVPIIR